MNRRIAPNEDRFKGYSRSLREDTIGSQYRLCLNCHFLCSRRRLTLHAQDLLCNFFLIQKLFKSENLQYKVYPVTRYSELFKRIEESKSCDRVKLFLFINCGGIVDLTESDLLERDGAEIFLFDVNKPINHRNI